MNIAYINPKIITWALTRRQLTAEQIATKTMSAEKIRAWASGEHPSETQAMLLAEKLGVQYLVLFLSNPPPPDTVPIPDLRTRSGFQAPHPSFGFIDVINDAMLRQDWFRDYKTSLGAELSFVGSFSRYDDVNTVAANMRSVLGLNDDLRRECKNWKSFLRTLIRQTEGAGILVMKNGVVGHATNRKLDAQEFQGFALSDPFAPVVFINDCDAQAAQIFTLAHELAHIWIGETGISNARLVTKSLSELSATERFCNQVAAEFLVPEKSFTISWHSTKTVKANLQRLTQFFWVSSLVALRRAYDLNKIDFVTFKDSCDQEYARLRALEEKGKQKQETDKTKQGDFWATFKLRNSHLFSKTLVKSLQGDRTTYSEASMLLGVSIATVEKFVRRERAA